MLTKNSSQVKSNSILISVLLPIYKEPILWITQSVESMLNQTFKSFELILLLDNPTNKELSTFLKKYSVDKRVKLVINKRNIGLPRTLNKGIDLAIGKYIARMDADDIAFPNRLKKQYDFMEAHPMIDLCGSQLLKMDRNGNILKPSNHVSDMVLLKKMLPFCNIITHPTWFIKKSVYLEVGKYRNFPNAEDYDLVYRIINAGKQVTNLDEILMYYRVHIEGQTGGKSLAQKVCFDHLKQLHRERMEKGISSFDESFLLTLIQEKQVKYQEQQQKAQEYLLKSFQQKANRQPVRAFLSLLKSFCASPIQRRYYLDLLNAKLIVFKHRLISTGML